MSDITVPTVRSLGTPWWYREKRLVVTVILLGLAIGAVGSLRLVPTETGMDGSSQFHTAS